MTAATSKLGAEMTDEQIHEIASSYMEADAGMYVSFLPSNLDKFARALLARQPAPPGDAVSDDDLVLVPRGLLGAACSAIDKKRDAPATLAALRGITFAPLDNGDSKPAKRLETTSENIARDIREGRFPQRSVPKMVDDAAPSVEQDERGVLPDPDTTYSAPWAGHTFKYHSPDQIIEYANARVRASTSANVAQGAEAVAWLVTSKRGLVRVAWTDKPTAEQIAIAEYDGDTITPLFAAQSASASEGKDGRA